MKIAVGTDMDLPVARAVVEMLRQSGHEVGLYGALVRTPAPWPKVATEVAEAVARGEFDQAVLFCWTGTGISMAANKVPGVRAALCNDAPTAAGARQWNDANILAMSLRSTSEQIAKEILEAWFSNAPSDDPDDKASIEWLKEYDARRMSDMVQA